MIDQIYLIMISNFQGVLLQIGFLFFAWRLFKITDKIYFCLLNRKDLNFNIEFLFTIFNRPQTFLHKIFVFRPKDILKINSYSLQNKVEIKIGLYLRKTKEHFFGHQF